VHGRLLHDLGVDICPKGDFGVTPAHIAAASGHGDVIRYILFNVFA
jgi:ankyrin repeat protein